MKQFFKGVTDKQLVVYPFESKEQLSKVVEMVDSITEQEPDEEWVNQVWDFYQNKIAYCPEDPFDGGCQTADYISQYRKDEVEIISPEVFILANTTNPIVKQPEIITIPPPILSKTPSIDTDYWQKRCLLAEAFLNAGSKNRAERRKAYRDFMEQNKEPLV